MLFKQITAFVLMLIYCESKYVSDSKNDNKSEWMFITRFCFLSNDGQISYEITYSQEYGPFKLLLYYDAEDQWSAVYDNDDKNCSAKSQPPHIEERNGQAIYLDPLAYFHAGNCSYQDTGVPDKLNIFCSLSRTFASARQRWWYVVLSRCNDTVDYANGEKGGIVLDYKIWMTNGDGLFFKQFSADEFYILQVDITFLVVMVMMLVMSIICAVSLAQARFYHTSYKLYMASLSLHTIYLVFMVINYAIYANDGIERDGAKMIGQIFEKAAYLIYVLVLILMAKGFNITRGKLKKSGAVKIIIFFVFYSIGFIVLYIFETQFMDPALVLYVYESVPGYILIVMRILAWIWFSYGIFFTLKHYPEKKKFFIPFYLSLTLWFWAGPIVILCANFAMEEWMRATVVNGVQQFVTLVGYCFFLFLTLPCCVNRVFPYHIKTTQIDVLPPESYPHEEQADLTVSANKPVYSLHGLGNSNREMDDLSHNTQPVAFTMPNGAPNFMDLFVTSQTHSTEDEPSKSRNFGMSNTYGQLSGMRKSSMGEMKEPFVSNQDLPEPLPYSMNYNSEKPMALGTPVVAD